MLGMNMPWMVVVLVATLVVIVASVGVAVTADAVSRHPRGRVQRTADTAAAEDPESPPRTVDVASRVHDWHRLAVPAWMTCVGASALAVAVIGVLIVVG